MYNYYVNILYGRKISMLMDFNVSLADYLPLQQYLYVVQNILSSPLIPKDLKIKIYKTVILPVVLYGCETWSLTLREDHRLRVFESRVLRRIFGPKRDEDGSWKKLHNDELHSLYSSPSIVRVIKSMRMRGRDMWHARERCLQSFGWEARRQETTGKT
jgi:hypothetical protein